jgi:NADH-quinone oxidoreductase subunit M
MILLYLIIILLTGGLLAWICGKWSALLARVVSVATLTINLIIVIWIFFSLSGGNEKWIMEYQSTWIPQLGIGMHLAIDGFSLLILMTSYFLSIIALIASWKEVQKSIGFFQFNILWIIAGITGVFMSLDLFLFYFFWEIMLIPMYFVIGIWGHKKRVNASFKFFLFTQASGLLMFVSIIMLYLIHSSNTGIYTFDLEQLTGTAMSPVMEMVVMSGFLIAFLVKLPAVPFHNWLPDAYTEAPTTGSVIFSMLKPGAYGLLRFFIPLFPHSAEIIAPYIMIVGVAGILYGAKLAYAQTNLKRLISYTSISHVGFLLIGIFAFNELAYQGVMMMMIVLGITTAGLFIISGQIEERMHTSNIDRIGGIWAQTPVMGAMGLIFAMASLGLPGSGNFIAEFLTLAGAFKSNAIITGIACTGLIAATIYSLKIIHKVFLGPKNHDIKIRDINIREKFVMATLVILIVFLGLFPQKVFDTSKHAMDKILIVLNYDSND